MSDDLQSAHKRSIHNRDELRASALCGCFYCLKTFPYDKIEEWCDDEDDTALCPECGVDSVIGTASGFDLNQAFLRRMRTYYFDTTAVTKE